MRVKSLASLSGLRIQRCHKVQCKSQIWPESDAAGAVALSPAVAPIRPLAHALPYPMGVVIKRRKEGKKKKKKALLDVPTIPQKH